MLSRTPTCREAAPTTSFTRSGLEGLAPALALRPALAQGGSPARVGVPVLGSHKQRDDDDRDLLQGLIEPVDLAEASVRGGRRPEEEIA